MGNSVREGLSVRWVYLTELERFQMKYSDQRRFQMKYPYQRLKEVAEEPSHPKRKENQNDLTN